MLPNGGFASLGCGAGGQQGVGAGIPSSSKNGSSKSVPRRSQAPLWSRVSTNSSAASLVYWIAVFHWVLGPQWHGLPDGELFFSTVEKEKTRWLVSGSSVVRDRLEGPCFKQRTQDLEMQFFNCSPVSTLNVSGTPSIKITTTHESSDLVTNGGYKKLLDIYLRISL